MSILHTLSIKETSAYEKFSLSSIFYNQLKNIFLFDANKHKIMPWGKDGTVRHFNYHPTLYKSSVQNSDMVYMMTVMSASHTCTRRVPCLTPRVKLPLCITTYVTAVCVGAVIGVLQVFLYQWPVCNWWSWSRYLWTLWTLLLHWWTHEGCSDSTQCRRTADSDSSHLQHYYNIIKAIDKWILNNSSIQLCQCVGI